MLIGSVLGKCFLCVFLALTAGACNNFFHDLIPPEGDRITSFKVDGQRGSSIINENTVYAVIGKDADISSLIPVIEISPKASIIPVTFDYVKAAFPSVDIFTETKNLYTTTRLSDYVIELIKDNRDFNVPFLDIPIDFSGPVDFIVISAQGNIRQYKVIISIDSGEPKIQGFSFAKYDNPELIKDSMGMINENNRTINAIAIYPMEMPFLSYALIPSYEIIADRLVVDGNEIISGQSAIQFTQMIGIQSKTITVWRDGAAVDYTLTITFVEDPDTIRSITDFRFNKTDNSGIAANAVASIINTESTGTINIHVFYTGIQPSLLIPRFVSPGNVSVTGKAQASGIDSHDFSSPFEYRVVSRNGQYTRTYTVKTEFISLTDAAPRILSFRFSGNINSELVQDTIGNISDGLIMIDAHYGGSFAPETLIPEFSAQGLVTVLNSIQISGSGAQNFNRQIKYTVTNPLNPLLTRDYWVQTRMLRDTSSDARIDSFGFYPEDNPGLSDAIKGKIDQVTGKIVMYAPSGSGAAARLMTPRFTGAGIVNIDGIIQSSGVSGRIFDSPVTYTVVSANGINSRNYSVELRELTFRIHVNANAFGNSDGTSWQDAFRSLKSACEAALEFPDDIPVEIWIASGTYTPGNNTADYFPLTANTSYVGGFAGHETAKSQRNTQANASIISGNLGTGAYARRLFSSNAEINGDLSFENLHFTTARGTASGDAGIYAWLNASAEVTVTECEFSNVEAASASAVIYVRGGGVVISRAAFTGCTGGAVNVQGTSVVISDTDFPRFTNVINLDCSRKTEITRVSITDYSGTALQLGGNSDKTLETVTVNRGAAALNVSSSTGTLQINGLTLQDITGEGIYLNGVNGVKYLSGITGRNISGSLINCTGLSSFTLTGGDFDRTGTVTVNGASVNILNTGIKNNSSTASAMDITSSGNTVIDNVNIDGVPNGRGIKMTTNGSASVSNADIKNCVTTGNGGGMYIDGTGSANISYTKITGCKANSYGGGMYLTCTGNAVVSNTTIDNASLTASTGYGGGIYRTSGSLKVDNNSVIKNISGSGVNCTGIYTAASLEVSGLELQNIPGYGIYTSSGVINLSSITATNIRGGYGVYSSMSSGSFTLSDSTFNSCIAQCSATGTVPIQVTGTNISNVTSSGSALNLTTGGAITIDRVNIDRIPNGRGIYIQGGTAAIKVLNSIIKNCKSTGSGGGMYIEGSGTTDISGTTIENCESMGVLGGGAVYFESQNDTSTIRISSNSVIRSCKSFSNFGGGLMISMAGTVEISGTTVENCEVGEDGEYYNTGFGGGISIHGGRNGPTTTARIYDSIIKNCKSLGWGTGGGISTIYCQINISNTTFELCQADSNGAVHVYGSNNIITGSKFINCTSSEGYNFINVSSFYIISGCTFYP
jgi:hypothetical protein